VTDVSTAALALAAGLEEHPGYDLLSRRPDGEIRLIEVKGRAMIGDVELSENEWIKAYSHGSAYWLYVVYRCATANPQLWYIQNPAHKRIGRPPGGWIIDQAEVFESGEPAN
jgi:hypothetical protein